MTDVYKWHPWFAWRPVRCEGQWAWLELILRRRRILQNEWSYRFDDIDLGYA